MADKQITSFIVYSQAILPQAVWFSGIIGKKVMQIWMILAAQHHWMSVILRLHHGYDHRDWLYASERNWDTTYMGDMHGRRPRGGWRGRGPSNFWKTWSCFPQYKLFLTVCDWRYIFIRSRLHFRIKSHISTTLLLNVCMRCMQCFFYVPPCESCSTVTLNRCMYDWCVVIP